MGLSNFDAIAFAVASGITATAGGGQANAAPLVAGSNGSGGQKGVFNVSTVATAADSVALPRSDTGAITPGTLILVINSSANSMQVFGSQTDTINGVATGTGVAQAAGKAALYVLAAPGAWFRLLSA